MAKIYTGRFKKVMLIDDDPIEHFINERILQVNLFANKIIQVGNAKDGLNYLQRDLHEKNEMPEVIFLDINMEGMDGYEFMHAFQQLPIEIKSNVKVVILSSSLIPEEISVFYQYPEVKAFLEKPLTKEKLDSLIL
jgi:CheY-like chemotaxis protein